MTASSTGALIVGLFNDLGYAFLTLVIPAALVLYGGIFLYRWAKGFIAGHIKGR